MAERRSAIELGIAKEDIDVQYPSSVWLLIVHLRGCFQISYRDIVKFLNKQLGSVIPSIPNYSTISKKFASRKLPNVPTGVDYFRSDIMIELAPYATSISAYNDHLIEKMKSDPSWLCLELEVETRGSRIRLRD